MRGIVQWERVDERVKQAHRYGRMKEFIDLAVFIDTPLDIALAWRMKRDFNESPAAEIVAQMNYYASHTRRAYIKMLETIQPDSDFYVDRTLAVEVLANQIKEKVG